jgi:hypothetical protein
MTSVLRELQAQWNAMVPAAQARGIRRVRILGGGDLNRAPLETIAYRRTKVEWLQAILGGSTLQGLESLSFGVEIECILPRTHSHRSVAILIGEAGIPCIATGYGHTVTPGHWKVTTDGSLGNYSQGAELVSPPLRGEEGFRQVMKVCEILTQIGAKVTQRCGLHVHVGVGTETGPFFKNLVGLYSSAQGAIDTFMPSSRRGSTNIFCQPIRPSQTMMATATTVQEVTRAIGQTPSSSRGSDRYCKLNLKSYFAYGTVEFRHHGGTVDGVKTTNWVRLCLKMVLTARAGEKVVGTVDELLEAVGADEAEKAYFKGRAAYFGRDVAASRFTNYGTQATLRVGR